MNRETLVNLGKEAREPQMGLDLSTPTWLLLSICTGVLLSILILPGWIPAMVTSLRGAQLAVYWQLSRAAALVAFVLLWLSTQFGLLITSKTARLWPGSPTAFDLHEYTSLLGLLFALLHSLILLGDRYIALQPLQLALPFASAAYRPVAVGLGQLAFYAWGILVGSFYLRKQISQPAWRALHWASFLAFAFSLIHGITAGTDSHLPAIAALYWIAGGSVLFMIIYRLSLALLPQEKTRNRGSAAADRMDHDDADEHKYKHNED